MIKLSKEATEPHDLKSSWPSLLIVALVFGLAFGFEMLARQILGLRYTGALLLLNAFWAYTVYSVARFGWKIYPWTQYVSMVGFSVLMGKWILPHSFIAGSPVQFLAGLAIFASMAPRFFTLIRKTPSTASGETGENR